MTNIRLYKITGLPVDTVLFGVNVFDRVAVSLFTAGFKVIRESAESSTLWLIKQPNVSNIEACPAIEKAIRRGGADIHQITISMRFFDGNIPKMFYPTGCIFDPGEIEQYNQLILVKTYFPEEAQGLNKHIPEAFHNSAHKFVWSLISS